MDCCKQARTVADIEWDEWAAVDRATLLFVVCPDGKMLLIRKKRGLGAGKINAPGGRLEKGETPLQAAVREVVEEVRVEPCAIEHAGELRFQFVDGYSIHVEVFRADDCVGEPAETDEAIPLWVSTDAIPYDEMWEDDRLWLPWLLEGRRFHGRFIFDDDRMLDSELRTLADRSGNP